MSHLGLARQRGSRLPLIPPFAAVFFATSPATETRQWLDQLEMKPSAQDVEAMERGLAFTRQNGFMCVIRTYTDPPAEDRVKWFYNPRPETRPVDILHELHPDQSYELGSLSAPVFGEGGEVAFVLALAGFMGSYTGAAVGEIGIKLRSACERITFYLNGRSPLPVRS